MSEWKDSYESGEGRLNEMADLEKERMKLLKLDIARDVETKDRHLRLQTLNMGICIYRDFGKDQSQWPAWIRARAAELGIE